MPFQRSKDGRFSGGPAKSPRKSPRKSPAPSPAKKRKLETPSSSKQTLQGGEKEIAEGRKSRGRPKLSLPSPRVPKTPGTDKSPIKTRRILNSKKTNPHCTLCKKARKEELKTCGTCELSYHLSHCLRMSENQAEKTYEMDDWTCPKCIRCSACEGIIDDCTNVECSVCQSAWHGDCFKGKDEGKDTVCKKCRGRGGTHSPVLARTPSTSATSTPSSTWKKGRPSLPGGPRKLPKGYVMISESVMHGGDVPSSSNNPETEAIEEILNSRARVWDNLVEEFQKQQSLPNSPLKRDRSKSRSPEKKPPQQLPRLSLQKISTHEDYDLFQSALRQLNQETASSRKASSTNTTSIGKWVYFGDSPKMKALYASPYPEDVLTGGSIFVCPYCMNSTGRADTYRIHMQNCEFRHPPGNEIYREGTLSFFEVDGAAQRLYCRSLCLLSKMFISSKTLHHEVETFLFYILTDNTAQGCRMVAYFSKEKNPSKNNNLSCLLTLPGQNRKGYGKLLIDLSYELSRLEHKIGSPEHPLSDLGLFAYRGYWRASILQHLRSLHHSQSTSIKSIALATRINPSDVINQLLRDKLLAYVDGNYFIKTGKRAYKWPLSFFRRRMIDKSKLVWKPGNDVTDLDPNYSKKRNVLVISYKKECGVLVSESESNCPDFDAPLSFVDCHRENRRWQQFVHSDLKLADGHISTVDAIRLFRRNGQRFCISGSRDRSMKIWDLARIQQGGSSKQWEVTKKDAAHGGWIWYIDTPRDDTFFSSGWDDYLKQWQITPDGLIEMGSLKLRSAVTSSIKMECGLVACSTYAKQISFVDPQDAFRIHQACTFHRAAIITMDVQGEKVYSCGDDKQMIVTDVRMPDKPYLTMKATQDSVQSISVGHGQVVCGTKKGAVKIYEPITMSLITSYRPKPAVQIRQVKHNRGSVIAMWKTQLVKIFTSGTKARVRAETREIGEPSRFDYLKGDFAICGGLGSIMFWPCPEDVGY